MKRDIDLVRVILLEAEKHDNSVWSIVELESDDRPLNALVYNAELLVNGGYLEGSTLLALDVAIIALTWKGHDLLDVVRDVTVLEMVRTILRKQGLSLTFEAIKAAAPLALKAILPSSG